MGQQTLSRVVFGLAPLGFAYAALWGPGPAGLAHLAGVALLLLVIVVRGQLSELRPALASKSLRRVGLVFALLNAFGCSAMVLVPLPTFAVLVQLSPVIGLLLAPLFKERVNRLDWLALPPAIIGGMIIVQDSLAGVPLLGWLFLAVEIFLVPLSVHLFAQSRREDPQAVVPATLAMMLYGCALLFLQPSTLQLSPLALLAIAGSGVLFAIGNLLIYNTFDRFAAHRTLLLKPLSTLTTIVAALILLQEPWSWWIAVGGALIFLASALVSRAQQQELSEKIE